MIPHSKYRTWARNLDAYPVLTRGDRRRLTFGAKDQGKRTLARIDSPWEDLPGIKIVGPSGGRPRRPPGLADRSDSRGRESDLTVYRERPNRIPKTCKSLQGIKSVYADPDGGKGRGAGR